MKVIDLKLNSMDDDDHGVGSMDDTNSQPRRLLRLPSGELLAWGGDTGAIRIVPKAAAVAAAPAVSAGSSSSNTSTMVLDDDANTLIRPWNDDDEDIRAVAVSRDGKRVALGMESGTTTLFKFDSYEVKNEMDGDDTMSHPLLEKGGQGNRLSPIAGPRLSGQIRDMQFHPLNPNILAVASEEGLCIQLWKSNNDNEDSMKSTCHLEELAKQHHDDSGIRSISFSSDGAILVSLAMDGRVCLWNTTDTKDPDAWTLRYRETTRSVTKKDFGSFTGADAWDRSCRPHFLDNGDINKQRPSSQNKAHVLALPGATHVQLLGVATSNDSAPIPGKAAEDSSAVTPTQGHIATIVAMASQTTSKGNKNTTTGSSPAVKTRLVTTGRDNRVVLWKVTQTANGEPEATFVRQIAELKSAPTDILWENDGTLLIACANGSLVVTTTGTSSVNEDVAKSSTAEASSDKIIDIAEKDKAIDKSSSTRTNDRYSMDFLDDDDDDSMSGKKAKAAKPMPKPTQDDFADSDDDINDVSSNKTTDLTSPSPAKSKAASRFVDDEAADADDDSLGDAVAATNVETFGGTSSELAAKGDRSDDDDDDDLFTSNLPFQPAATLVQNLPEPQAAFAPSSSPLDLARRFLCWNHIGAVTIRREDLGGDRNTVDINFTDSGVRRPVSFTDNLGFIVGSLGEDGAIFATDLMDDDDEDDADDAALSSFVPGLSEKTREAVRKSQRKRDPNKPTGSSIFFHRFETFASLRDKDWHVTLPSGERALGCATGEGWAAVVTSRRFLRLFSSGGNQGQVFWIDGDAITIVGRARFLAVFYHASEPLRNGTQQIGYKLIDAVSSTVLASGTTSAISSRATLSWAGFSNDGSLVVFDSTGMVSMLVCADDSASLSSCWEWIPTLDTLGLKKSSDDSFWPVTVYDGKLVCVPLKGGTKYPDATRRPVTAALSFKLPLARGVLTKSALEELSLRAGIALRQKKVVQLLTVGDGDEEFDREYQALSAQVDKVTLKMFAATVEAGKLERALDLVERLHLEKSFELAMAIADSHRKLVDLIEDTKERKFPRFADTEYDADEQQYDQEHESSLYGYTEGADRSSRISPDGNSTRKRDFNETDEDRQVRPRA